MKTVSLPRSRHRLHAMPTSTGYEVRTGGDYVWDGLKRGQTPFTVLQYTISGEGNLRYENRTTKVQAGETLLLLVPHNHRYWLNEGERWEFFWISMHGAEALRIHEIILNVMGPVFRLKHRTVDHLADLSLRLIEGKAETPASASAVAYEAAMTLYDDVFGAVTEMSDGNVAIARALNFIEANPGKPLTVDELAGIAGLSRAHFSREFAVIQGMPPAEYMLQERMRRAAKLMSLNPGLSIKEVAVLSGFDDPNYFSKVFRRIFGASPTDFRTTGMYSASARKRPSQE
jgi:AraC-like DNA-binding protein